MVIKMVDYVTLGKRIKQLRRMRNWTQEKLGDMTGYSKSFIGCVENHSSTVERSIRPVPFAAKKHIPMDAAEGSLF